MKRSELKAIIRECIEEIMVDEEYDSDEDQRSPTYDTSIGGNWTTNRGKRKGKLTKASQDDAKSWIRRRRENRKESPMPKRHLPK